MRLTTNQIIGVVETFIRMNIPDCPSVIPVWINRGNHSNAMGFTEGNRSFHKSKIFINFANISTVVDAIETILHEYRHLCQMRRLQQRFGFSLANSIFSYMYEIGDTVWEDDAEAYVTSCHESLDLVIDYAATKYYFAR